MKSIALLFWFLFLVPSLFGQEDYIVLSSSQNSLIIEYRPVLSDSSIITFNGKDYIKLELKNGSLTNPYGFGLPEIHTRKFPVGVPAEFGNTIQILNSSYVEISGRIVPIAYPKKEDVSFSLQFLEKDGYDSYSFQQELVSFGGYGLIRNMQVQDIIVNPIHFSPSENRIKLYTKIVFQITFGGSSVTLQGKPDLFLDGVVINYQNAKAWSLAKPSFGKANNTSSVLAAGKWYRFEAPQEGMYKITRSMLASYGIDASTVDPRTIKIYNNGGKVVPESIVHNRPQDLAENAITVIGEEDGKFDENDYILFYGKGTDFWDYDLIAKKFKRAYNPYSKENYYWITAGGTNGKRIQNKQSLDNSSPIIPATTSAFAFWEEDKINIGKTGRYFMGDEFTESNKTRTYTSKVEGIVSGFPIYYRYRFANNSSTNVPFKIEENGVTVINKTQFGFGGDEYTHAVVDESILTFNGSIPNDRSILKFTYSPSSSSSTGYLDYFEIYYQKLFKAFDDFLIFFARGENGIFEYRLNNFSTSDIHVYDVTDYANVKIITQPVKLSGGEFWFQSSETSVSPSKYLACLPSKYLTPKNPVEIKNQDIRGIATGAKYIIISPKAFRDQADRLKRFRESESKLTISTIVIDYDEIFNEFSCGMKDVAAIRDFLSYAYNKWTVTPEYVLFYGDGNYDYKNIEGHNRNFILTYQTENSFDQIYSYVTDDYFARIVGNDDNIDLAFGRLNIGNLVEAKNVVDKIINYENNNDRGSWRNRITLVADDGKTSKYDDGTLHTGQSEDISVLVPQSFDQKKIYLAAYPTVITSLGRRKPEVNQAIIDAVNNGTLILNFIGHGSPDLWTHEQVFVRSVSIPQFKNKNYFFLTAATCDFGYYDKPITLSGAEELILKENSGAIGVFTASRPVYSYPNKELNEAFYRALLKSPRDSMNLPITLGKAFFIAKRNRVDPNDQKFHLFADPALRLQIPQYDASIDSINGAALNLNVQLKALGKVKLEGRVRKSDNSIWNDFNGEGVLTVFDSERKVPLPEFGSYSITDQGGIIFKGRISITSGRFSTEFVVPKDISYENRAGKIIFYFYNLKEDGIGFTNKVIIGGTDTSLANDGNGPAIDIYFDDLNYGNASLIKPNSTLLVKLFDETGLNTTGTGIGHKMLGVLNDNENNPIDFTNYFTGDLDAGGKAGIINYRFSNLEQGNYKLLMRAWDVFNNASSEITYFKVVESDGLAVEDVYNYPNPFKGQTTFTFQHNLNGMIDVKINIYSVAGRLIQQIESPLVKDRFVRIDWDGRDRDGDIIANGTYLYKVIIKSVDGQYSKSVLGKLAIVR